MKINKEHITRLIFKAVCKLSLIPLPKSLKETAEAFSRNGNFNDKDYQRASVLSGDFIWKAISIVLPISPSELKSLDDWLNKNASRAVYHRNNNHISTMYDSDGGFINFGTINFTEPSSFGFLANLNMHGYFCTSCYLSVSKFPYGINYLSLYFKLNDSATEAIKDIDVSTVNGYCELASLNPFKKEFKNISICYKSKVLRELTSEKINDVCSDVIKCTQKLLNIWNIKKQSAELELIADIYRNTNEKYFTDAINETVTLSDVDSQYIRITRNGHAFCDQKLSLDDTENFLCSDAVDDTKLNAIFIKSKIKSPPSYTTNDFISAPLNIHGSHLIISVLFSIEKQYTCISKSVNNYLIKESRKPDITYNKLLKSQKRLDSLKEKITAFGKYSLMHCEKRYQERTSQIAYNIANQIDTLNGAIEKRLSRLNSEIQANNLMFNRRYSIIVGVLIIIQIIFAVLSVDFNRFKEGKSIEPRKVEIIINSKSPDKI